MRPAGEVRQALYKTCVRLARPGRGPTLRELAAGACVGLDAARRTVNNMQRAGLLVVPRDRVVPYRNRPVAEYEPVRVACGQDEQGAQGAVALASVLQVWVVACP